MPLYEGRHNVENRIKISEEARNSVICGTEAVIADIAAAMNAGMDSIFYDRKGVGSDKATHVIRELSEAVGIILG